MAYFISKCYRFRVTHLCDLLPMEMDLFDRVIKTPSYLKYKYKFLFQETTPECGIHLSKDIDIRAGGSDSDTFFGEWPHVCAIFKVAYFLS